LRKDAKPIHGREAVVAALAPGFLASDPAGRYVAAGVVMGAAIYQFTPAKNIAPSLAAIAIGVAWAHPRDGQLPFIPVTV
jgi:hypothetical protein